MREISWRESNNLGFLQKQWPEWVIWIRTSGKWAAARPGTLLTASSSDELNHMLKEQTGAPAPDGVMLTAGQAAARLGVSERTIRRWAEDGVLTRHRNARGHLRYAESEVKALPAGEAGQQPFPSASGEDAPAPPDEAEQKTMLQRLRDDPREAARIDKIAAEADAGRPPYLLIDNRKAPLVHEVTTIGRGEGIDIRLDDPAVSTLHAEIYRRGPYVYVADQGLSANGTFVNGRAVGRRVLANGDVLMFGQLRCTVHGIAGKPAEARQSPKIPEVTRRELDVLTELCRPALSAQAFTAPASAREIATILVVTEAAVKQHLLRLHQKFKIPEGPDRRARLANAVIEYGLIRPGESFGHDHFVAVYWSGWGNTDTHIRQVDWQR